MKRRPAYVALAILAAGVAFPLATQAQSAREPGNVLGGGATAQGGGDNMAIVYSTAGAGAGGGN